MQPHRFKSASAFLLSAAITAVSLGAAEPESDDVSTKTTPVTPAEDAPSKSLSESLDPTLDSPLASELPAPTRTKEAPAPSDNVTINLINSLVQKGILSQAEAQEMIAQAQADAQTAAARADVAALPPTPSPEEEMRVTYIPEVVRTQMRDQIQQELMAQAREEQWGENAAPEWTSKFRPFGDIRVRYANLWFPGGNDNTGAFPNFNKINTGSPFDTAGNQFSPQYNVDQNRDRMALRARFGAEIMLGDGFDAGFRIATGNSDSPVSTNTTLGGGGGNFSKYALWLDRAFISYDAGPGDGQELVFMAGRFDNPFFSSDMMWDDDLGFDGIAVRGNVRINDCTSTFFTLGYFPLYNTGLNFPDNQPAKFESSDKWLKAAQLGINWKISEDLTAKVGVAYYDFDGVEGELSSPYIPLSSSDAGDTDGTRPSFAQKGNTYMALRDIDNSTSANDFGNLYQYQYYGLASKFRNLAITGQLDYDHFDPVRVSLKGEFIKNLAFDGSSINGKAVNNRGSANTGIGAFEGGDSAWNLEFVVGNPAFEAFGDWKAGVGYRYVESDAVVDAFTDSDFGGGGTNVQGFTLGGAMAFSKQTYARLRWMSSDEVTGPPLSSDILQIDFNAKF